MLPGVACIVQVLSREQALESLHPAQGQSVQVPAVVRSSGGGRALLPGALRGGPRLCPGGQCAAHSRPAVAAGGAARPVLQVCCTKQAPHAAMMAAAAQPRSCPALVHASLHAHVLSVTHRLKREAGSRFVGHALVCRTTTSRLCPSADLRCRIAKTGGRRPCGGSALARTLPSSCRCSHLQRMLVSHKACTSGGQDPLALDHVLPPA